MAKPKTLRQRKKVQLTEKQKAKLEKKLKNKRKKKNIQSKGFHAKDSGQGRYKNGIFWSKKNQKEFVFRSAYEFGYFHILEADDNVVSYIVEPFKVPYVFGGKPRSYIPDLMVLYHDGSIKLIEIKPAALVRARMVQAKATAARRFIDKHIKGGSFEFVTEEDIFDTQADYKKLLKLIQ